MKRVVLAFAALVFLGLMVSPLFAECTETAIHNAVAEWAGVRPELVTDTTRLDGLGGRSWPADAPSLITTISLMCGCAISASTYGTFVYVDDIDEFVGVDDLDDPDD